MPNNANIDERVVEMRIDNRQFVDGAEKTISVLDKLKNALKFGNAGKELADLNGAADKVDLSGIAKDVDSISDRFSSMGIVGMRVIQNLTDSVYGFATRTIKDLTLGQITAGFDKYSEILTSTKTIMAATREDTSWVGNYASQMDYVNDKLEQLNWFTDETSYNLGDMVNNIGKFTNAGVSLEDAVRDMEGIATWAGLSGANANEASRAMYNLAQAMAVGEVKLMDWRSIENANMATREFKQTVIEIAAEAGTLTEVGDGLYKTLSGAEVSVTNFNEALSEGWFTSNVLEGALDKFGRFTQALNTVMNDMDMIEEGVTTTDVLDWLDKIDYAMETTGDATEVYIEWQKELADQMGDLAPNLDALHYAYEILSDDELELGRRAFVASQEYKTLDDAINATRDAVSSGWMQTFQYIIGDAEESKEVWTAIGDELFKIFAASGKRRNQILKLWKKPDEDGISGRDSLLSALTNLYQGIKSYISPIVDAFDRIFSWGDRYEAADKLRELTYRFEEFTERIGLSDEAMEGLTNIFASLFSAVKKVLGIFKPIGKVIGTAFGYLHDFVDILLSAFSGEEGFQIEKFTTGMTDLFGRFGETIGKAWTKAGELLDTFKEFPIVKDILETIEYLFKRIQNVFNDKGGTNGKPVWLQAFEDSEFSIESFLNSIQEFFSNINLDLSTFSAVFGEIGKIVSALYVGLTGDPEEFRERIKNLATMAVEGIREALSKITFSDILEGAKLGVLGYTAIRFAEFVNSFKKTADKFGTIPEAFTGVLNSGRDAIKSFSKSIDANRIIKIALAIGILAGSIWLLSKVPDDKFMQIAVTLSFLVIVLAKVLKNLDKINVASGNGNKLVVNILPKLAANIIAIAIFLGVVAGAIAKIARIQKEGGDVWNAFNVIFLSIVTVVLAMFALSKIMKTGDMDAKVVAKIVVFAAVIRAAGGALAKVGDISPVTLLAAGAAILMILGATALILAASKDFNGGASSIGAILAITIAFLAMVPVVKAFAKIGSEDLGPAIGAFIVFAGALLAFMVIANKIGSNAGGKKFATTMLLISAALLLFAIGLSVATPAIITLTASMIGVLTLFKTFSQDGSYWAALGFLFAFGVALAPLAVAMVAFGAAALLMATALLVAGAALLMIGTGLSGAALGVTILTATLVPFAKALAEFAQIISENGDVIVQILDRVLVGIVMLIIARKMHIALAALSVIMAFVQVIHDSGPQILEVIRQILVDILQFLGTLISMVVAFLVGSIILIINKTANTLREKQDLLVDAIENLFSVIVETALKVLFRIIGDIFGAIWGWITDWLNIEKGGRWLKEKISGFGDYLASATENAMYNSSSRSADAGANLVDEFATGADSNMGAIDAIFGKFGVKTKSAMDETAEVASDGGSNAIASFAEGAGLSFDSVNTNFGGMADGLMGNFDQTSLAETFGGNFVTGFGNGAIDQSGWLNDTMAGIAGDAAGSFSGALDINSPSRLARSFGLFWDEGYVNGLLGGSGEVNNASETVAIKMADAMYSTLTTAMALAENDFAISPVITPIVDMTNVNDSVGSIGSMLSGSQSVSLRTSQGISRSMADLEDVAANMQSISNARANMSQDSYEINIYTQPGMDEAEVADQVIVHLRNGLVRKGAALG